jgi:signal transduction histidine kinase
MAWLRLRLDQDRLSLVVEDDGVGGADATAGTGLRGLQDRLEGLGGTLQVVGRAGGGTRLTASVPLQPSGIPA